MEDLTAAVSSMMEKTRKRKLVAAESVEVM
jgi:hypothetical protein